MIYLLKLFRQESPRIRRLRVNKCSCTSMVPKTWPFPILDYPQYNLLTNPPDPPKYFFNSNSYARAAASRTQPQPYIQPVPQRRGSNGKVGFWVAEFASRGLTAAEGKVAHTWKDICIGCLKPGPPCNPRTMLKSTCGRFAQEVERNFGGIPLGS